MATILPAVAAVVLVESPALGQHEPARVPVQPIAWIDCHPGALGEPFTGSHAGIAVERGMAALLGAWLGDPDLGRQMAAPIGKATQEGKAWRWCLMEYRASWSARPPGGARAMTHLACVVQVRHGRAPEDGELIELPSGRAARVVRAVEPWKETAHCQSGDDAVHGFGRGALERWFGIGDDAGPWLPHRQASGVPAPFFLEAYVDLNAVRAGMPDWFSERPPGRAIAGLGLANTRDVMLRAALTSEGLVASALTWAARSDSPGVVHRASLTEAAWPEQAVRPDGARWTALARADWLRWAGLVLDVHAGAGDEFDSLARETRRLRWFRDHGRVLDRLVGAAGPFVSVHGGEGAGITIIVPFDAHAALSRVDADARSVFGTISRAIQFDPGERVWSVRLGSDDGAGALLEWMLAGPPGSLALIGTMKAEGPRR